MDILATLLFCLQEPMVHKGVVDSLLITLAAVQGGGDDTLPVQEAVCKTFSNLSNAADNQVHLCGWVHPVQLKQMMQYSICVLCSKL